MQAQRLVMLGILLGGTLQATPDVQYIYRGDEGNLDWFSQLGSHFERKEAKAPSEDGAFNNALEDQFYLGSTLGLRSEHQLRHDLSLKLDLLLDMSLSQPGQKWLDSISDRDHFIGSKLTRLGQTFKLGSTFTKAGFKLGLKGHYKKSQVGRYEGDLSYSSSESMESQWIGELSYGWEQQSLSIMPLRFKQADYLLPGKTFQTFGFGGHSYSLGYQRQWTIGGLAIDYMNIDYTFQDPQLDRIRRGLSISGHYRWRKLQVEGQVVSLTDSFKVGTLETKGFFQEIEKRSRQERGYLLQGKASYSWKGTLPYVQLQRTHMNSNAQGRDYGYLDVMFGIQWGRIHQPEDKISRVVGLKEPN